jgi:Tol biopolymer transport system component/tRNA A-37 threonylcarbamoyl transferase component Bud32
MDSERWRQIEELYHRALERTPEERSAFVESACHDDHDLQREVQSLLDRSDRAESFLETSALAVTAANLSPGASLGPYQILGLLGVGGMGKVYKAHDTRLGRTVAIKILNEHSRRLEREASAASALNHPNIVTLHDIGHDGDLHYLVMEYVPGDSLARLITPKGLPLAEAISYCTQIANALSAAHAAAVTHRDLKPANVIVTPHGQVKVLDFGLAKVTGRAPSSQTEMLTQESVLTATGAVLGTGAYMSPEQASARPLDYRTDIFSLGVMLYEMVAGRRPFRGTSQVETLHAIINDPFPPLAKQPPEFDEILEKALAKDPKDRYQSAADLGLDLRRFQRARETKSLPSMRATAVAPRRHIRVALAAAILVVIAGAGWWLGRGSTANPDENPLANAQFTRFTDFPGSEWDAAISPDGKFVAFLSDRDGPFDIFLGRVGAASFLNLTQGREQDLGWALRVVGFSGDGSQVWLHDSDPASSVRTMPLTGGEPRVFLGKRSQNVAWSRDGARLAYHTSDPGDPIFVADPTGANAHQIYVDQTGVHNHFPAWSPDGMWLYFVHGIPSANEMDLWRISSVGGTPERLTSHHSYVGYPTPIDQQTVLYVARGGDGSGPWLWALDVGRKLTRRVSFGLEKYTSVAASSDGRRLVATVANPVANLWSVPIGDRPVEERDVKPFPVPTVRALMPRFGEKTLFYLSSRGMGDGLWRYRDGKANEVWNGADGALLEAPAISVDGRRVAFVLRRKGKLRLQVETSDGTEPQVLADDLDVQGAACWSPDNKWIATGGRDARGAGLFKIPVDSGPAVRLVTGLALNPVWSPDGSLIAYAGANVGEYAPLLGVSPEGTQINLPEVKLNRDGERIRFLPNGKGLVFMQGQRGSQDFWLLDLATKKTKPLTHLNNPSTMRTFDITGDSKQIVFDRLRENSDIVLIDLPR